MKKLFITALFAFAFSCYSQRPVSVDVSIKYYDLLNTVKKNNFFNFIGKHDKMTPVYDEKGTLKYYEITGSDYVIKFNSDTDIVVSQPDSNYYLTVVGNDVLGHGYFLDKKIKRVLTYFFQNEKVIKESVINNR